MKQSTLVGQLLRSEIVAMGIAWFSLACWLTALMTRFENGDLDRRMTYFAQILAETASADTSQGALQVRLPAVQRIFVTGVIESLENAEHYDAAYQVRDRGGKTLYSTPEDLALPKAVTPGVHETQISGKTVRLACVRSTDGRVEVVLVESLAMRWSSILPMLKIIGGGQILIFLACLAVLWWSARRGVAPLRTLASQISARKAGDLRPIDGSNVFTEVAPLIEETNKLLLRETERFERERAFLADAAHELRTPLAAIAAQAHLLVQAQTREELVLANSQLEAGLARTSHVLSQLLSIARLEARGSLLQAEETDVAELVRRRVAEFARRARESGLTLEVDGVESIVFDVEPGGFSSLLDNLVDNAIRYSPRGGRVVVSYREQQRVLCLEVLDDGPGIAPEFRERIFERFFRIPGAQPSGSGLGLAIVHRIARSHEASLIVADGPMGRGLKMTVLFPNTRFSGRELTPTADCKSGARIRQGPRRLPGIFAAVSARDQVVALLSCQTDVTISSARACGGTHRTT